jgi:NAD(P)-dependent dehydrogenase (short-subunit alcohol dehydrogenase family)/acyl carrier protein
MIAHLWTLTAEPPAAESAAQFDRMQELGFHSLIHLAQALGGPGAKGQIVVISNHLHEVVGDELLAPAKATLLGPCKVIPQEFPHLICRSIDLDLISADATQADDELFSRILAETAAPPEEVVVAYRGRYRWVQSYAKRRLPAQTEPAARLRQGGVYLITGGLGGIGLVLAEYLARTVGAKLVLVGRSPLPPRSEWEQWLASHDDEDGTSRKLRQIRELEAGGAEVLPLSADVADRDQMEQVVARAGERFGAIHGVIHAAGIAGGGLIQLKTRQEVAKVFQPKASGLLALNAIFENRDLDFLVLFSSISSVLGEFGQVDYCAANLFLDAWAQHQRAAGRPLTVAINWDTWQEVGIAVKTEVPAEMRQLREEAIRLGIANPEGQEAFARILAQSAAPQVIVCTRDLTAAIVEVREYTQARVLAATGRLAGGVKQPRPELETSYEAPTDPTEEAIAELWQEVLGLERVGRRDNFFDLGGHSLIATQIMSRLRDAFQIELAIEQLFKAPTVAGLAEHVEAVRWAALGREGLSGEPAADRDEGEL